MNGFPVEHMQDLTVWKMCMRLFGITEFTTKANVHIPFLNVPINQYQLYAAVLLLRWARDGKNGGFLADGMGVGKVRPMSTYPALRLIREIADY